MQSFSVKYRKKPRKEPKNGLILAPRDHISFNNDFYLANNTNYYMVITFYKKQRHDYKINKPIEADLVLKVEDILK